MNIAKITCLFLAIGFAGCTEFQAVQPNSDRKSVSTLAVGDTVEVVTANAEKFRFQITAIEEDALAGEKVRIPFDQVRILSVRKFSAYRTSALLLPFVVTAAGVEILGSVIPPTLP